MSVGPAFLGRGSEVSRPRVVVLSRVSREEKAGIFAGGHPQLTLRSLSPSPRLSCRSIPAPGPDVLLEPRLVVPPRDRDAQALTTDDALPSQAGEGRPRDRHLTWGMLQ